MIRRDDRFLTIRRSARVIAPGTICFPGGGIEPGETAEAALIRECHEEIDVDIEPIREIWQNITPWNVHLSWWKARLDASASPRPNPAEVAEILWLTLDEISAHPDLLQSNIPFLKFYRQRNLD